MQDSSNFEIFLLALPDIDVAVQRPQIEIGAAAVDGSGNGSVCFDTEAASAWSPLNGWGGRLQLDIKIAVYRAVIGAHFQVGFCVWRKRDVYIRVLRYKRHRLAWRDIPQRSDHSTVCRLSNNGTRHIVQNHTAVGIGYFYFAFDAFHGDISAIHRSQIEIGLNRYLDVEVSGIVGVPGVDRHDVVFFFDGEAGDIRIDPSQAVGRCVGPAATTSARCGFDDDLFSVIAPHGHSVVEQVHFQKPRS